MERALLVLFLTILAHYAQAQAPACALQFTQAPQLIQELESYVADLKSLQQSIQNEPSPIVKTLLIKNRDILIASIRQKFPQAKIDLDSALPSHVADKEHENISTGVHERLNNQIQYVAKDLTTLSIDPSGNYLIAAGKENLLNVYNLKTSTHIDLNGEFIVLGSESLAYSTSDLVHIYDYINQKEILTIPGIAFGTSNSNQNSIAVRKGDEIQVYDLNNGKIIFKTSDFNNSQATRVEISGSSLVVHYPDRVYVYDLKTQQRSLALYGWANLSPDGNWMTVSHQQTGLQIFSTTTMKPVYNSAETPNRVVFAGESVVLTYGIDSLSKSTLVNLVNGKVLLEKTDKNEAVYFSIIQKILMQKFVLNQPLEYFLVDPKTGATSALKVDGIITASNPETNLIITRQGVDQGGPSKKAFFRVVDLKTGSPVYEVMAPNINTGKIFFTKIPSVIGVEFVYSQISYVDVKSQQSILESTISAFSGNPVATPVGSHFAALVSRDSFGIFPLPKK